MKLLTAFFIISILYLLFLQKDLLAQTTPQPNPSADYSLFTGPSTLPTITNVSKSNALQIQVGNPPSPAPTNPPIIEGPICSAPPQSSTTPTASPSASLIPTQGGSTFYCQADPRWGGTCSMAAAGCGPTSLAMVLSSFNVHKTPPEVDQIFRENNWRACGNNVSLMTTALESRWLEELGFEVFPISVPLNLERAQELLSKNFLIIGSVVPHIFVIDGVDIANNQIHMRDPARCQFPEGRVMSNVTPWGGYAWYYAYAIKKVN